MTDTQQTTPDPALTPEQIAILAEFADSVAAGRRLMKLVAWAGGFATGLAALAYYVLSIARAWHGDGPHPPVGGH